MRSDTTKDVYPSRSVTGTPRRAPALEPPKPWMWIAHVEAFRDTSVDVNFQAGATPFSTGIWTSEYGSPTASGVE
ncbi:hypothetical protein GCM10009712_33680 [Pseudarthrobacter sulfonivorans]